MMVDETDLTFTCGFVPVNSQQKAGKLWGWTSHLVKSYGGEHAYSYRLRYTVAQRSTSYI
jgi:hypothetical protein